MSDTSVANELRGLVDNATQQRRSYAGKHFRAHDDHP